MAVDRGSLRYVVELDASQAIENLTAFRGDLLKTRKSWRAFRQDIRSVRQESRSVAVALNALAKETAKAAVTADKAAESAKANAKANREGADAANKDASATKKQVAEKKKLTDVEKQLKKAKDKARLARIGSQDPELRSARIGLQLTQQRVRLEDKLRIIRKLSRQGRDIATGELPEQRRIREQLEAQNNLQREQARLGDRELISLRAQLDVTSKLIRLEQQRLSAKLLADQGRLASGLTIEESGLQAFNRDLERLQIDEVRKKLQEANPEFKRLQAQLKGTNKEVDQAKPRFQAFNNLLDRTRGHGNRLFFTFRRLIGIFAAFTIIRNVIQFFNSMVVGAVRFNAAIEQSVLGIASLFTAVGEVRTATGQAVDAQDQLTLAQRESRRQINLLRKDALATVATFQELRDAFQVAIAPGIDAGLGVDQIRKFSIQISQAAAAIGLQQNQLAEEIRSILAGTIQLRTTRIAAALGITNEDIRQAKDLGILAEFLNDRFEAFTTAGQEALRLFNAVLARVRDAFQELLRQGSVEFFDELKGLLEDVFESLVTINEEGIQVNPDAVNVVKSLFDGLRRAVAEARRLLDVLQLQDFEAAAARTGDLVGTAAESIGAIIEGFLEGAKDLRDILRPITGVFDSLIPEGDLQEQISGASRLLTIVLGIGLGFKVALGFVSLLVGPLIKAGSLTKGVLTSLGLWEGSLSAIKGLLSRALGVVRLLLTPVGLLAAGIAVAVFEFAKISAEVFGIELRLGTVLKLVRVSLVSAFQIAAAQIGLTWTLLTVGLENGLSTLLVGLREGIFGLLQLGLEVAKKLGKDVADELARLNVARDKARLSYLEGIEEGNNKIKEASAALNEALKTAADGFGEGISKALKENADAETADELLARLKAGISDAFNVSVEKEGFVSSADQLERANEATEDLIKGLRSMPGILSRGNRELKGFQEILSDLAKDLTTASDDFSLTLDVQGLSGVTEEFRTELAERRIRLAKEQQVSLAEISKQEVAIANAQSKSLDLQAETLRTYKDQASEIDEIVNLSTRLLDADKAIADAQKRLTSLISLRNSLQKAEREEEAAALSRDIAVQQDRINKLKTDAQFGEGVIQSLIASLGAVADGKLIDLIKARVTAAGEEVVRAEELDKLQKDRLQIEGAVNKITLQRISTIAARQKAVARDRIQQLQAEVRAEQQLLTLSSVLAQNERGGDLAEASGALGIETARLRILQRQAEARRLSDAETIKALKQIGASRSQIQETTEAQLQAQQELNMELQLQEISVERSAKLLDEARKRLEEPFSFGFQTAFAEFEAGATNSFEQFRQIGLTALEGFRDTASGLLTDLFDPRKAVNSDFVREAFGEYFLSIADQAFNALVGQLQAQLLGQFFDTGAEQANAALLQAAAVQLTVAASTLAAPSASLNSAALLLPGGALALGQAASALAPVVGGVFAAATTLLAAAVELKIAAALAASTGLGFGAAEGGRVPGSALPSPAHFSPGVQGLRTGGSVRGRGTHRHRPRNLDPRDTVPIWAQKDEFMMRLKAVRKYGAGIMQAINDGRVDPFALRALVQASGPVHRPSSPGFAEGGLVSDRLADANAIAQKTSRSVSDRGIFQRALLVPDEETMERLMAASPEAQRRWAAENRYENAASSR